MSTTSNTTANNITVFRGDDFATQLVFTDTNGAPIDIIGWEIYLTVKNNKDDLDSSAVLSLTVPPTDHANGIAVVSVSNTETNPLLGPYYYRFQFKNAAGVITTITSGTVTFVN